MCAVVALPPVCCTSVAVIVIIVRRLSEYTHQRSISRSVPSRLALRGPVGRGAKCGARPTDATDARQLSRISTAGTHYVCPLVSPVVANAAAIGDAVAPAGSTVASWINPGIDLCRTIDRLSARHCGRRRRLHPFFGQHQVDTRSLQSLFESGQSALSYQRSFA